MIDELDQHRLRTFAETGKIITDGPALQRSVARLLALYEASLKPQLTRPPLLLQAHRHIDDERWRGAGDNAAVDATLWEGIALDIGRNVLGGADCKVHAGSGLITFSARAELVAPAVNMDARVVRHGTMNVRIISDNRETAPTAELTPTETVLTAWPELKDLGPLEARSNEGAVMIEDEPATQASSREIPTPEGIVEPRN